MLVVEGYDSATTSSGPQTKEQPRMTAGTVTADGRARVLADGNQMPMLGLGVWQVPNGPACVNAVRWALDLGVRHICRGPISGLVMMGVWL